MARNLLALGLGAALLGGCTLAPTYERPAAPVPAAFPQGPSYAPPQDGPAATTLQWRDFFRNDKLKAVIDQALAQNRDLRVAIANIEAARAQYHVQRAALLPTVNVSGGATYERLPPVDFGPLNTQVYTAQVGFSSYELDLFGKVRSLSKAALEQYLATEEARRSVQTTLIGEVATDYLTLAADDERLAVAKDTLKAQQASLDLINSRFSAGVASLLEVHQAETTVEQARADVAQFTTQAAQDRNALDLVAGAPTPDDLLPTGVRDVADAAPDIPAGLSSAVLLMRPDVLQAEHQLKAANANIGAARAAFFPTISLTAQDGFASASLSNLFSGASRAWSFAPNIAVPIFDAGRNRANLAYAKAERDSAVAQYEKAIQTGFSEVANALARSGTITEQVAAERALVNSASEALKLSTARYERGTDPYLDVLTAEQTLYSAQQTLVSIELIQLTNAVTLYRALGGGVS